MPADLVNYEYDLNGRLKKLSFSNDDELLVTYDNMGNREEVDMTIATPLLPLMASPSSQPAPAATDQSKKIDESDQPDQADESQSNS